VKTYLAYENLPSNAYYLGSQFGDGSVDESLADLLADNFLEIVRLKEPDGTFSYFEIK
jgi:hypothetical protein